MSGGDDRPGPRWLSDAMLLVIHARQVERNGGAHGVLGQNVVLSALAAALVMKAANNDAADDVVAAFFRARIQPE